MLNRLFGAKVNKSTLIRLIIGGFFTLIIIYYHFKDDIVMPHRHRHDASGTGTET